MICAVKTLLIVCLVALLAFKSVSASEKVEFWNIQRKGANYFNVEPQEKWFKAAQELGIEWVRMAYDKWTGEHRDFLMGDAGNFRGIVQEDLAKLTQVLDWAQMYDIKVVITPLGLPGNRWIQNNESRRDPRLWNERKYWQQAVDFWLELATELRRHPAVYAYNILNEPTPELKTGIAEHGPVSRYIAWYAKYKGTSHDLPAFYETVIAGIRQVDSETPIMLDAGWYAQPNAFVYWPRINDDKVLYSFHMYEPYDFTNHRNFRDKHNIEYPGKVPFAGEEIEWNKQQIERYFSAFFAWGNAQGIPRNRLVCGEFGCYRRNQGCGEYLTDVIAVLNEHNVHWAFYSFREDEWDGYDYEVGTGGLGAAYWAAKDAGENPKVPRKDNPLFDVIKEEFSQRTTLADLRGPIADPKVRRLTDALSSYEWKERQQAADSIGQLGVRAKAAIPSLIETLKDEEWFVRKAAAAALSSMGPEAKQAVPALAAALADEEWQVRDAVVEALEKIAEVSDALRP